MNTNLAFNTESLSDDALVESSLAGDREAFAEIVTRYQSPICALAYSACGNVARSQDLTQEIFITAWCKLGNLQKPDRFKAWLYGIARNLIHNAFRRQTRNPVAGAESLEDTVMTASPAHEPDEQAISKEEEVILWHVLSGLPDIYREPMVLFYRQNESIPQVADVLAISEEAVRQRLSRGRAMLNERVTKVVQNGLRRTGPADGFAIAVIAALPVLAVATTAKGAVVGMAATKSATGQAAGVAGFFKAIGFFAGLVAIPAMIGSFCGHKLGRDAVGRLQQRQAAAKFWRVFGCGLVLVLAIPLLLTFGVTGFLHDEARATFLSVMTFWLGLAYPFVPASLIFWVWLRRRKSSSTGYDIDFDEVAARSVETGPAPAPRKFYRRPILLLTAAAASLLVFCYLDMRHNVVNLSADELHGLVNQTAPANLTASISVSHYRSIWGESPDTFRSFLIEVHQNGKTTSYWAPADDANVALLAEKGIKCPTYIQGRDFEVLGTPGRFLPFLAAFVLFMGFIYLRKRSRPAGPAMK
ncbi:MAG: sigma-70 family RNA polymerase sigma factor [Verrucomicrobiae bacterium]|nr:sigma-70 family RNA polymerase sigma factor [Verrucomicrobiae bacterium]